MQITWEHAAEFIGDDLFNVARQLAAVETSYPDLFAPTVNALGMSRLEGLCLTRTVQAARIHEIDRLTMRRLGWPRLRLLAPLLTHASRDRLIALALQVGPGELAAELGRPLGPVAGNRVRLRLDDDQHALFERVMFAYGAEARGARIEGLETALMAALQSAARS
jgi:hypothetical protein